MLFLLGSARNNFRRPTHLFGLGGLGMAKIEKNPKFPAHDFFQPGRQFPVRLRHANVKYMDDAASDVRSFSIKFADSDSDSPLDIVMHTGRACGFWDTQSLEDFISAQSEAALKKYVFKKPY